MSSDYMVKKRERAVFLGSRLKVCALFSILWSCLTILLIQEYSDKYHADKEAMAMSTSISKTIGGGPTPTQLMRSNSIQEELFTTF